MLDIYISICLKYILYIVVLHCFEIRLPQWYLKIGHSYTTITTHWNCAVDTDSRKIYVVWNSIYGHALNLFLHFVEIVATSPQYYALELYIFIFIYIAIICYLLITKTASHNMRFPTKSGLVSVIAEFMERCDNISMCRKSKLCHGFELSSGTWNHQMRLGVFVVV